MLPLAVLSSARHSGLSIQSPLELPAFPSPPLVGSLQPCSLGKAAFYNEEGRKEGPLPFRGLGNVTRLPARLPTRPPPCMPSSLPFSTALGDIGRQPRSSPPLSLSAPPSCSSSPLSQCHQAAAAAAKKSTNENARNCRQPGMSLPSPPPPPPPPAPRPPAACDSRRQSRRRRGGRARRTGGERERGRVGE